MAKKDEKEVEEKKGSAEGEQLDPLLEWALTFQHSGKQSQPVTRQELLDLLTKILRKE